MAESLEKVRAIFLKLAKAEDESRQSQHKVAEKKGRETQLDGRQNQVQP